jgi:integrase
MLSEIASAHVQEFLGHVSKADASWYTVRNLRNLLSRILRNAVEWDYIHRNPVTGVKLPPKPLPSKRRFLSPAEVRGLIAQLKEPYRSMVLFDILTGLSRGELFALQWSVVDFARSLLEVREAVYEGNFGTPKTRNRNRRISLSRAALDVLKFYRLHSIKTGPMDLIFASRNGTPIRPDNVLKRVIHPACDRLKIPRVGWHALRTCDDAQRTRRTGQGRASHSRSRRH